MAELIKKGELLADFNNSGIHIEFDLPVEEILGEDVDIDDFSILVQDAVQAYRKMVIDMIQKQPTTTESEIRAKAIDECIREIKEYAVMAYDWDMNDKCEEGKVGYIEEGLYEAVERLQMMKDEIADRLKGEQ